MGGSTVSEIQECRLHRSGHFHNYADCRTRLIAPGRVFAQPVYK